MFSGLPRPIVYWNYIADSPEPVRMTTRVTVVPTDTRRAPHSTTGPSPMYQPSAAEIAFVCARYAEDKVVFSICTGLIVLGASGVADGRRATGNRGVIGQLMQDFPRCSGAWRTGGWLMRR